MPRTLQPSALHDLPERFPEMLRAELPSLANEIVEAIREAIPEYARPLDGPYGLTLRSGVARALDGFAEWLADPTACQDGRDKVCRRLGRFEAYEGRSLDALQSAYRIGALTGWQRIMRVHERYGLTAVTVSALADALFTYLEELAGLSAQGYREAKVRAREELAAHRRRMLHAILDRSTDLFAGYAEAARWTVPATVTMVALQPAAPVVRTLLDADLLTDLGGAEPYLLVPGPLDANRRATLAAALTESRGAAGLTVPLERAADSLRWARRALSHKEIADEGPLTLCEDHLVTLWLLADVPLIDQIARRRLAGLDGLGDRQRDRIMETLRAWLRTRGTAARVGTDLGVHPQTVRYRMRQIERTLGDDLTTPDARFAIEAVLRAMWLRERAAAAPDAWVPTTLATGREAKRAPTDSDSGSA